MSDTLDDSRSTPAKIVASIDVKPAKAKPNKRRRRRPFDRRYGPGRRVLQLEAMFKARLGAAADDPVTATAIARAAETVALSEHLRARMLRGEAVSADDTLRATRTAELLTRRLLARVERQPLDHGPSLADIMREGNDGGAP